MLMTLAQTFMTATRMDGFEVKFRRPAEGHNIVVGHPKREPLAVLCALVRGAARRVLG